MICYTYFYEIQETKFKITECKPNKKVSNSKIFKLKGKIIELKNLNITVKILIILE